MHLLCCCLILFVLAEGSQSDKISCDTNLHLFSPFTSTTVWDHQIFLMHLMNVLLLIRSFIKIISWHYVFWAASCTSKSVCLPTHVPPNCFSNSKTGNGILLRLWHKTSEKSLPLIFAESKLRDFDIMSGWLHRSRQSCLESPVVLFNIRVKTLAGHEDTLRGSLSDHSAECFLLWSSQSLDAAIYPSNLHSRFGQTEPGAFSDLSSARWPRCLHPRLALEHGVFFPHFFFLTLPAELLLERTIAGCS